ncbi:ice-binding family protein [Hymenobacter antarcticus]|uniref:Por secretion system C-terminal sorting domain-containing protein n=1 Tax=Hymenobacter antarcticus TaxID=486270 RepID=A0ABP7QZS6_9BACT
MKILILLALTSGGLLSSIHQSCAQAPNLGLATPFALFTSIGDFNNTGATAVTGNIGTNAGVLTGFPPGTFTGTKHVVDSVSADVAKDVDAAYNSLADFTQGSLLGTTLGSGQMLTAGTYRVGTGASLTGVLNLNGEGDANALFIIKINGPLSAAALSNVRLINAAAWENVYWKVSGPVTIGANAAFKGTILSNGDITLLANAALQGRGLSRLGVITLDNNVATISAAPMPLPVQLISFTAEHRNGTALVRWATASELKNAYFAVQSSVDGRQYRTVGRVSGHATTTTPQAYAWTDANLERYSASVVYYRLKQVDSDSSSHYSSVRTVTTAPIAGLRVSVYPSPSRLPCNLHIDTEQAGPATLRLTNALGRVVAERQLVLVMGSNPLPLEPATCLSSGLYFLHVEQGALRQTVRLVRE